MHHSNKNWTQCQEDRTNMDKRYSCCCFLVQELVFCPSDAKDQLGGLCNLLSIHHSFLGSTKVAQVSQTNLQTPAAFGQDRASGSEWGWRSSAGFERLRKPLFGQPSQWITFNRSLFGNCFPHVTPPKSNRWHRGKSATSIFSMFFPREGASWRCRREVPPVGF